ncbi:hypothetical protein AURDEDRAFT_153118 [Auricularia subglabra TFB-10046 SS5]|nr:hypothetical protein AURDEDRAFT_153118 [Auricularia subglabra TFB-10046 SS5]
MTLLTFGAFVLLFSVVLVLAFEESLAQAKKKGAQGERAWVNNDEERWASGRDDEESDQDFTRVAESALGRAGGYPAKSAVMPMLALVGADLCEQEEPTEIMLYRANVLTGSHAFEFPRAAGLSIRVHPPPNDSGSDIPALRPRAQRDGAQAQLLRVHDGYMFIEDRLLRFKTDGGRKKQYEAWHDSRWRQVEQKQLWIRNEDDEAEHVKMIMPQIPAPGARPGLQHLPMELVVCVLNRLQQSELRVAASVSRSLYKAAIIAGYTISFRIVVPGGVLRDAQLERFKEATRHAQLTSVGLELIVLAHYPLINARGGLWVEQTRPFVVTVFGLVTTALQHLASLTVRLPDTFIPEVNAALRYAAPRLLSFVLDYEVPASGVAKPLPPDLFDGHAPKLRTVALCNVPLSLVGGPILAFKSVRELSIEFYDDLLLGMVAPHFPQLSCFQIFYDGDDYDDGELLPHISHAFDIREIPYIQHVCTTETWGMSSWHNETGKISARMDLGEDRGCDPEVLVVAAGRRWRYAVRQREWDMINTFPLADLPNVGSRLEYLRLDALFLIAFITGGQRSVYGALKRICIDIYFESDFVGPGSEHNDDKVLFARLWPPYSRYALACRSTLGYDELLDPDHGWSSSCPLLEELTISACGEPVTVRSAEVVFLARALGRTAQPNAPQPALVLAGAELDDPVLQPGIDQTFSSGYGRCQCNDRPVSGAGSPLAFPLQIEFYDDFFPGVVASYFPDLSSLHIDHDCTGDEPPPALYVGASLAGLMLKSLIIDDYDDHEVLLPISRAVDLRKIAFVRHSCTTEMWRLPVWQNKLEKLSARLRFNYGRATELALLAHAVGRANRPVAVQPALVLVGATLDNPAAHDLIGKAFSVSYRAFLRHGSDEDHERELWDVPVRGVSGYSFRPRNMGDLSAF